MSSDIRTWLDSIGLEKYAGAFVENEIDLDALPLLSEADLQSLGLPLGPRRKLQRALGILESGPVADDREPKETEPGGERRQVTVLFADLCNFTSLSTVLDSEEMHALLNRFFAIVDGVVTAYGGKIDKHVGDAVMAVFGAPTARTDDPVRAVRAACDIHSGLQKLDTGADQKLVAHIGIASGQVVASRTGSADYSEYTVTGETVNLASRLDDLAGPGETLISQAVYNAVSHVAACDPRGDVQVDGFPLPLQSWRVVEVLPVQDHRRQGPFVGRVMEQRQFSALLSETLQSGRGHTVMVRGEPGIGKTRLIEEFMAMAEERGFSIHHGLVLDFGTARGQDALGTLVRSLLSVPASADAGECASAAAVAVAGGLVDPANSVFLNDLLDLPQSLEQQSQLDAMEMEKRDEGRRATIARLVESSAANRPLNIYIEDIHWADDFTLSCIVRLASSITRFPALLIMTSRLEGSSTKQGWSVALLRSPMTTMELHSLLPDEALTLAKHLVSSDHGGIDAMAARSEGNPLFLEQLLRNASEGKEDNLPGTLHGLVLARMDRLAPKDREALQAASVIGQNFRLDALRAVMEKANYEASALIEHKLVRYQGSGLLFDHALIRDAVYTSLLSKRRRELHARAARFFESRDQVLHAEHLERAGNAQAASAYLSAAEAEAGAYRTERAHRLAERGLVIAQDQDLRFQIQCRKGEWELDMGSPAAAIETFSNAAESATSPIELCHVNIGLAAALRLVDRQSEALSLLNDTETVARREKLDQYLGRICHLRGNLYFTLGDMNNCRLQHEAALDYSRKANDRETEARALGGLADASYAAGKLLTAHDQFQRCVALAEEMGLGRVAVANRSMMAITRTLDGDVAAALDQAIEATEAAKMVGQDRAEMVAHHGAHQAYWLLGKFEQARDHCNQGLALARKIGAKLFEAEGLIFVGENEEQLGNRETAYSLAREAVSLCRKYGMAFIGPIVLARLAATSNDPAEREASLQEGEALLSRGTLSHNYIWFYRDAIEVALDNRDWDEAERCADALQEYTSQEPIPLVDFFIMRGKALAALGRGEAGEALISRIQDLHQVAKSRYLPFAAKLSEALVADPASGI